MNYRRGSHTVFQFEYHFVWMAKYRYRVLAAIVAERVNEKERQVYDSFESRIVEGVVSNAYRMRSVAIFTLLMPNDLSTAWCLASSMISCSVCLLLLPRCLITRVCG